MATYKGKENQGEKNRRWTLGTMGREINFKIKVQIAKTRKPGNIYNCFTIAIF